MISIFQPVRTRCSDKLTGKCFHLLYTLKKPVRTEWRTDSRGVWWKMHFSVPRAKCVTWFVRVETWKNTEPFDCENPLAFKCRTSDCSWLKVFPPPKSIIIKAPRGSVGGGGFESQISSVAFSQFHSEKKATLFIIYSNVLSFRRFSAVGNFAVFRTICDQMSQKFPD